MRALCSLGCLLLPAIASAQAFVVPPAPIDLSYITNGADYDLRAVEASPTTPGKELLIYLPSSWLVTAGRWHPSKHGLNGALPGPGVCVEPWTGIATAGPVWHFNTAGDFTGDGIDDFVIYRQDGAVDLYTGRGLTACR